jgi:hypothetical protein
MSEELNQFSVIDHLMKCNNRDTQTNMIMELFAVHPYGTEIPKRQLEKLFCIKVMFKKVDLQSLCNELLQYESIDNNYALECLSNKINDVPGDVQRSIRAFHDKYEKFGLKKRGKSSSIMYYWENISKADYDLANGAINVHRNIFKTDAEREAFICKKDKQCEICSSDIRLAIDHFRAYSVYKIDSPDIAVLLCETCNNIHHNYDASKILKHKKSDYHCIRNWIKIEKRIREMGYMPNEEDILTQNDMIELVDKYWIENKLPMMEELLQMKLIT